MTDTLCPSCKRQYGHLFGCQVPALHERLTRLLKMGYTPEQIKIHLNGVTKTECVK